MKTNPTGNEILKAGVIPNGLVFSRLFFGSKHEAVGLLLSREDCLR